MMKAGEIVTTQARLKEILGAAKTIAIIGLSSNPDRDSYKVAAYLQKQGYRIIPISPKGTELLGEKVFRSLDEVSEDVDIVNVFRRPEDILPHAHEAIRKNAGTFWMQLGIENQEAAELLVEAGLDVVMNRCTKVDHDTFIKKNILI